MRAKQRRSATDMPCVFVARQRVRAIGFGGEALGPRYLWWNYVHSSKERIELAKAQWLEKRFALPARTIATTSSLSPRITNARCASSTRAERAAHHRRLRHRWCASGGSLGTGVFGPASSCPRMSTRSSLRALAS